MLNWLEKAPTAVLFGVAILGAAAQDPMSHPTPAVIVQQTPWKKPAALATDAAALPGNLDAGPFRPLLERMLRTSRSFRRQCARLSSTAGLSVTIRNDVRRTRSDVRAFTSISRGTGSMITAVIHVLVPSEAVELIGHEIEHIIEQLDALDTRRDRCGGRSPTGMYETCRAIEAGRRVAQEVLDGQAVLLRIPQRDYSGPLDPATAGISADGRFAVFLSAAGLVPGAPAGRHLYVLDLETGLLHLESTRPGWGVQYSGVSGPRISGAGTHVVVDAPRRIEGLENEHVWTVLVLHRPTATLRVVGHDSVAGPVRHNLRPVLSTDGRTVAFESVVAGGQVGELYLARLDSGRLEPVHIPAPASSDRPRPETARSAPASGNRSAMSPALSSDGRFVAFASAVDAPCSPTTPCAPQGSGPGVVHIYVRDTHTGSVTRITRGVDGGQPNASSSAPAITADGRYVAFASEASNLVRSDRDGESDIFVHDRLMGTTEIASRRPDGRAANGPSRLPAISGDGTTVAFQSLASDLICIRRCGDKERDDNHTWDVYVYERASRRMLRASADGRGEWMAPSGKPALDHSGRVLVFTSRQPLDDEDLQNDEDLFIRIAP